MAEKARKPVKKRSSQGKQALVMKKSGRDESASRLIDARIHELGDWRGKMLSRLRALIKHADPEVVEEWKWMGTPVWSHPRVDLHRRDLQACRRNDILQGGLVG